MHSSVKISIPPVQPARPVTSSLLADQVFDAMHGWIARGEWKPGRSLRIREVAAMVGTSDMPVREAFRRLEQAGLITVEPYKGGTVRELSIDELEHVYDVRIMLEPEAALQGALNADDIVVADMRRHWALLQEASARGDIAGAVVEDERLLTALYAIGGNDVLAKTVHQLWDSCRPYKSLWVANAAQAGLSAWNHITDLINAAADRDGAAAFTILDETYRGARATVRDLLTTSTTPTESAS